MDNTIQFIGLVTFTTLNGVVAAIMPAMSGYSPPHQAFIAYVQGDATPSKNWSHKTFVYNKTNWDYVSLNGEDVVVLNATGSGPQIPAGIPSLKRCCKDFDLDLSKPRSSTILIEHGVLACARDGDQIDTVLTVSSDQPLTIKATLGGTTRTLTFKTTGARFVTGNFPIGYIDGSLNPQPTHDFLQYYRRLGKGGAPSCNQTPGNGCPASAECQTIDLPIHVPMKKGAGIDCSNSTFP